MVALYQRRKKWKISSGTKMEANKGYHNDNAPKATSDVKPMLLLRRGLDRTGRPWEYRRSLNGARCFSSCAIWFQVSHLTSSFILHPSSITLHPSSFIHHLLTPTPSAHTISQLPLLLVYALRGSGTNYCSISRKAAQSGLRYPSLRIFPR